jgi:hypothetical protein
MAFADNSSTDAPLLITSLQRYYATTTSISLMEHVLLRFKVTCIGKGRRCNTAETQAPLGPLMQHSFRQPPQSPGVCISNNTQYLPFRSFINVTFPRRL